MTEIRLYQKNVLKDLENKYFFKFKKALGQNFLIDGNIIRNIVSKSEISENSNVLEIGTGIGTLTEELSLNAKNVLSVEIDKDLKEIHEESLAKYENVKIIYEDFLKLDEKFIEDYFKGESFKVCANLPYYVTTPILEKLFESSLDMEAISVMVQKEVADRIVAKSKSKDYGSLSLYAQYYSEPEILFKVKKDCFYPKPKIDSAVVRFKMIKRRYPEEKLLFQIIRASFMKRRKTLKNALNNSNLNADKNILDLIFEKMKIDKNIRAEELGIEQYIELCTLYKEAINEK